MAQETETDDFGKERRIPQQSHNWRQLVRHRIHYMQENRWDVDVQTKGGYPTCITTRNGKKILCDEVRDWREAYMWLDGFLCGADATPCLGS